jgi:hypothetical protein
MFCCVLDLHGGRSAFQLRAATALAEPFRAAGKVVKELIHVTEHERRAPKFALALDPHASRGDLDSKAAQNRLKKRRATTTTHHAVGSRNRGAVARWNEALYSLFSSVFFKVKKQCIKQRFIQDYLLFLTAPPQDCEARFFVGSCKRFISIL